jgi:hypothetical protein
MPPRTAKRKAAPEAELKTAAGAVEGLVQWLVAGGASLDGLDIRTNADGSYGLYAAKTFKTGSVMGNLPKALILDPLKVLAEERTAIRAAEAGGTPAFCFWLSLADARRDPSHEFAPYIAALPLEAPDPCAWTEEERRWLDGTQLGVQVERERRLLADEFDRVATRAAPQLSLDDLLWARGVHLSRCFPRALVDAASLTSTHEVIASDVIDSALIVEHGGSAAPRVTWSGEKEASGGVPLSRGTPAPSEGDLKPDPKPDLKRQRVDGEGSTAPAASRAAGGAADAPSPPDHADAPGDAEGAFGDGARDGEEHAAGNLGCMLPMYDMFDHKVGQAIGWEAGCGGVRFRCRTSPCVPAGSPLYNNYGPKGNQELLFTYGFAVPDNPLDSVEGIVVGCAPASDAALGAERRRLLDEQEIEYSVRERDGALLIGPFGIWEPKGAPRECERDQGTNERPREHSGGLAAAAGEAADDEEAGASYFPPELLYALQVIGMDSLEEGPMLTVEELRLLRGTLEARLQALLPTEASDGQPSEGSRKGAVAAYRDGQRRILRAAIQEVDQMADGAISEDEAGEEDA